MDDVAALRLVTEEAVVNLFEHAYDDHRGFVEIEVGAEGEQVRLTIRDRGRPFDPDDAPDPDLDSDWEERRIGGLGWHLIRQLTDEVEYVPGADGTNSLTLVKTISRPEDGERPRQDREESTE